MTERLRLLILAYNPSMRELINPLNHNGKKAKARSAATGSADDASSTSGIVPPEAKTPARGFFVMAQGYRAFLHQFSIQIEWLRYMAKLTQRMYGTRSHIAGFEIL